MAIGLLEDDNLLRSVLGDALSAKGLRVSISCGTVEEFLVASSLNHIDCAVLDLHLGSGANGIDVANRLVATYPKMGIVFLTSFDDPRLVGAGSEKMPDGCVYLRKHQVRETGVLVKAISDAIAKAPTSRSTITGELALLSDNQIEILALVAAGMSNSEIARIKSISEKSVEATLTRIVKLLNLKHASSQNNRVHMARVFFRARGMTIENSQ